jgi:hypothetical protein
MARREPYGGLTDKLRKAVAFEGQLVCPQVDS